MVYKIKNVSADNIQIQDRIIHPGDVITAYNLDAYNNMISIGYLQILNDKQNVNDYKQVDIVDTQNQVVHDSEVKQEKVIYKTIYKEKPVYKENIVYKDKQIVIDIFSMELSEIKEYYKNKIDNDILNSFDDKEELIAYIINKEV